MPQDYAEAAKWTRRAAEQGNVTAQENLGVAYDRGHGVPQDFAEAVRWHKKAAEQGNTGAQNNLGVCYEGGQGVPQDYNEAVKWFRKAADQGLAEAQSNLLHCCQQIVWKFSGFLALHTPLIGDCSLLPYPKKTILYAIYVVKDDCETKLEATDQSVREASDNIINTLSYLLTRLSHDWQEIELEDKEAIERLGHFDSFPDWALPLKTRYIDDERACNEACDMAIQVMVDKVNRAKITAAITEER